ncbi:probable cation-transporting ATPase 13A3, partial [Limulus polyphemus]|uniref:Probable cation-transporting ATPase 13A3 n=1 Tax=Limulus polyphemus TaxID=6850 RepID=A0ABM1RXC9_LIMPO
FLTAKGELVRSILFSKPLDFRFYQDSVRFVLVLFCISAFGMVYTTYLYIQRHATLRKTINRVLDIITIVVPPILPAAMTVGTVYAQNRLKKSGIFCVSPPRINVGGKLKLVCFDKTGTLTEEGLDLWGVIGVENGRFQGMVHDLIHPCVPRFQSIVHDFIHPCVPRFQSMVHDFIHPCVPRFQSMVHDFIHPCVPRFQSIVHDFIHPCVPRFQSMVHDFIHPCVPRFQKGELIGDPLDITMFTATKWVSIKVEGELIGDPLDITMFTATKWVSIKVEGELIGDPLDINMFTATKWLLTQPGSSNDTLEPSVVKPMHQEMFQPEVETKVPYEIAIIQQFPFSSAAQRMSVICRTLGKPNMDLYVKGAPEKIASLCLKNT